MTEKDNTKIQFLQNVTKILKKINLIIEKDIVYVSDNIGYVYAYSYLNNNLIWAKNFKVPNRSNLKLFNEKLVFS